MLLEEDLIERFGIGCGFVDERGHQPAGPLDLPVPAVEHVLAAVRGTVDKAVAATHAEVDVADDKLEPAP